MSDSSIREYIGARYVPIFGRKDEESIEWDNTDYYEPLTIVLHEGNSYTSRQYVPIGIDIDNEDYWALTGNYNAQVELYRRETAQAQETAETALENSESAVETAGEAMDEVEELNDKFTEISQITIEPLVNYLDRWAGFIVTVPRDSYSLGFCRGNGGNNDSAYNTKRFALDLIKNNTVPEALTFGNINLDGLLLVNNVINRDAPSNSSYTAGSQSIIAFDSNGNVHYYDYANYPNITATQLRDEYNCHTAFEIFSAVKIGNTLYDLTDYYTDHMPRPFFGVDSGHYYFLFIMGRNQMSRGVTGTEGQAITSSLVPNADWYLYDGGGSMQFYINALEENIVPYRDMDLDYNYARARALFVFVKEN